MLNEEKFTERQKRGLEYHKEYARTQQHQNNCISYEIGSSKSRRWWNQLWAMYTRLLELNLYGKKVLVVGCGFGHEAFQLAKLGADVFAFDISHDSLSVAQRVAEREKLTITFDQMTAEKLDYRNDFFDCVVIRIFCIT